MLDALLILALVVLIGTLVFVLLRSSEGEGVSARVAANGERPLGFVVGGWVAGAVAALALLALNAPPALALAAAVLIGAACRSALGALEARRRIAFDVSLAAALDLVVASLRSGAALVESLATAADESSGRVGALINELCERIRLGEQPGLVLDDLAARFPSEGSRLFAFTLASHFDSGGSAASSLAQVSRTLRERVDVLRRATSQSVETQASVVGILLITYGLAFLMWKQYPDRVADFTGSELGLAFIVASVVLQAVGLLWISRMIRVEV